MRACLHCRSYLWNWAILNGALWLEEAGKELIKAETTDKLNSAIRCIIGGEKYKFVILPSPQTSGQQTKVLVFTSQEGLYISKVILDWTGAGGKQKESQSTQFHLTTQIFLP